MATFSAVQPDSESLRRVASPIHTIAVLAAHAYLVVRGTIYSEQIRAAANLNRVHLYERMLLAQWLGFAFVLLGVWWAGLPLITVLGKRWHSIVDVLRDIGIAILFLVGFSITAGILFSVLWPHPQGTAHRATQFLLPHGRDEMMLWVAVSVSAGICEETLYRGYLQRQFAAFTKSVPAAIFISGTLFGLVHIYQGARSATVIAVEGILLGVLAHWRRSLRPGMISHSFQDSLAPILIAATKR